MNHVLWHQAKHAVKATTMQRRSVLSSIASKRAGVYISLITRDSVEQKGIENDKVYPTSL